jgi:hypothetical protein
MQSKYMDEDELRRRADEQRDTPEYQAVSAAMDKILQPLGRRIVEECLGWLDAANEKFGIDRKLLACSVGKELAMLAGNFLGVGGDLAEVPSRKAVGKMLSEFADLYIKARVEKQRQQESN